MCSLLLCSSVYGGAVWFHFTSARPRDGLASFACRSLTSTSHPPSSSIDYPALLSFPFFLLIFFLLGSYRTHVFLVALTCTFLSCLPIYGSPKIDRKGAGKILKAEGSPTCLLLFLLSPLLQRSLLYLSSFLLFARISCVCVCNTCRQLRARGIVPFQRPNGYLPNYFGVGFLWVPEKSPWARHGNRDAALLPGFSRNSKPRRSLRHLLDPFRITLYFAI